MSKNKDFINLGKAKPNGKKSSHTPSKIQADTLFNFTTKLDYLITSIKNSMLSPRYCIEDIKYLKLPIKKIAYPMRCFCDINLHRLDSHLEWYGYYGLAFSKEWGMKKHIQPVQYINPDSKLCKDFSVAFKAALKSKPQKAVSAESKMKNFLLHEMMYYKPYEGKIINRVTKKSLKKCFTDECEWRFIPDVTVENYEEAYYDDTIVNDVILLDLSNSMEGNEKISIKFEYSDLKYIIIKTFDDFKKLTAEIELLGLDEITKHELISKIIIWDASKEDF